MFFPLIFCLAICSCKKEEIRTYRVAEEPLPQDPRSGQAAPQNPQTGQAAPHDHAAHSNSVTWNALPGWKQEEAGSFLIAAYSVPDIGRLTVSKLGGDGGGIAANVNRWREQIKLQPLPAEQIKGQPMPVTGSNVEMQLFNLNPENASAEAEGIFAAILPIGSETWYFKLTGSSDKLRDKGSEIFITFIADVRIAAAGTATPAPSPAPAPSSKEIQVTAPEGWTPSQGSQMRVASFMITAADGTTADVSVIPLPGDSASVLDNVNRWRGQIRLAPLAGAEDPALGVEMDGAAGKLFVTHMVSNDPGPKGKKEAISTAILKSQGMTWFFKIMGDADLVQANREKFESFALSAKFK